MTVLTSQSTVLGTAPATLPRVNLLPPEIAEQRAFRRVQMGLGLAVAASVGVVGILYMSAAHSVSSAQATLDSATQQQSHLQSQIASYSGVTQTYQTRDAVRGQIRAALADEVRYSQVMADLSLAIPANVWLTNLVVTQTPAATAGAATAPTTLSSRPGAASVVTPIGTVTFSGVAFSHDDVATWLDAIAGLKPFTNAYFTNSAESMIGSRPVVDFTSSAVLTSNAYSGRYNKSVGG